MESVVLILKDLEIPEVVKESLAIVEKRKLSYLINFYNNKYYLSVYEGENPITRAIFDIEDDVATLHEHGENSQETYDFAINSFIEETRGKIKYIDLDSKAGFALRWGSPVDHKKVWYN